MTDSSMLKFQYGQMLDQLILLQLHAEDPNCPCSLTGVKQGELGEYCEPKHLRAVVALARETISMDEDEARVDYLEELVLAGTELLAKMESILCGKEVELGEYATWARDKRKPLEELCYSSFCEIASSTELAEYIRDDEIIRLFDEPRWCFGVKEVNKNLGRLAKDLGMARSKAMGLKKKLEMPISICKGQAEMFVSPIAVLDPYGSRCRDPETGLWLPSEECGFEPAGITTSALGMDGLARYDFEFRVVSLDKLIVSHNPFTFVPNPEYPKELQPRLRERAATKIQVEKIAANLEPDAVLTDFHTLDRGAPIIGPDWVVEAGNGRVMGIIKAVKDFPEKYGEYRTRLKERAVDFGLRIKDVDAISNPVLVRVRITDVDRGAFTQEANSAATIAPSAIENARVDAQKITTGMLQELVVGENQSLEDALRSPRNQAFANRFLKTLPENIQASLVDAHGYLNRDGVHRMAMAVFVSAFQGDTGLRLAEKAFESIDMDVRNAISSIAKSLGLLAQAEALIRSGDRDTKLSIGDDLAQVVTVYSAIKRTPELTVEKYLAQGQLQERELTDFEEKVLVVFEKYRRSPKKLGAILSAYAQKVIDSPPPAQATLLPGAVITKEQLWESAVKAGEAQPMLVEGEATLKELEEYLKEVELAKVDRWVKRWRVPSSSTEGHWIVAIDKDGNYGCSCPVWRFRRQECHHIKQVKAGGGEPVNGGEPKVRPKYVLAQVLKPTYKEETNELFIPLVAIPDVQMMEATICYHLLKHGYSLGEVRELRHIPREWTAKAIYDHIERHGEAVYPEEWYDVPFKVGVAQPALMEELRLLEETCERPSDKFQYLSTFFTESAPEAALFTTEPGKIERKIDTVLAQLESGIEEIQESSKFKEFIDTMSKFHDYSLGNIVLITIQSPGASRIAGYRTWQDLGRNVRKGEHGIMILAPCFPPKPKKEEEDEEEIEPERRPTFFKVVHVFDIAQTEGKELPGIEVPIITGEETGPLFQNALTYVAKQDITVSSVAKPEVNPALMGYWSPGEKLIWVRPDAPQDQRTKTLLHETAHAMCQMRGARDAEVMAESVAYTVANHFGYDTGIRSFPYVAVWARDVKLLKNNLETIRKVAKDMIEGIEKVAELSEVARLFAPMKLLTKKIRGKLPPLYSQEKVQDPIVQVKFFTPDSNWTWYGIEFDGKDLFFGWVVGLEKEMGYFSLKELESARGPLGLAIERDKWFTPLRLSEVKKLHQDEEAEMSEGLGQAVITGLGLGIGFKAIDELAKFVGKREAEVGEKKEAMVSVPRSVWQDAVLVSLGVAGDPRQREGLRKGAQKVSDYVYGLKEAEMGDNTKYTSVKLQPIDWNTVIASLEKHALAARAKRDEKELEVVVSVLEKIWNQVKHLGIGRKTLFYDLDNPAEDQAGMGDYDKATLIAGILEYETYILRKVSPDEASMAKRAKELAKDTLQGLDKGYREVALARLERQQRIKKLVLRSLGRKVPAYLAEQAENETSSAGFTLDPRHEKPEDVDRFYAWTEKASTDEVLGELCERADYLGAHLCIAKEGDEVDREWTGKCPYIGTDDVYSELGRLRFLCWKLTQKLPSSVTIIGGKEAAVTDKTIRTKFMETAKDAVESALAKLDKVVKVGWEEKLAGDERAMLDRLLGVWTGLTEDLRTIYLLMGIKLKEEAPYATQIPKDVIVFKTTIEKHYRPVGNFHKDSIRIVKPKSDILVTLGCLKKHKWDAKTATCSPNPTVLTTVVPNNKGYMDELKHLKLVHPEVKVKYRTKEAGVEPRVNEDRQEELVAIDRALENVEVVG